MSRVKKTACGCCGKSHRSYYDKKVRRIRDLSCGDARIYLEIKELKLDWHIVKNLEQEYMEEQVRRNPVAAPHADKSNDEFSVPVTRHLL